MKKNNQFIFLTLVTLLLGCTYDRTLIYHKDYKPERHTKLQLNGFYRDAVDGGFDLAPIFFYEDGSVIFTGKESDTANLRKRLNENPKGIWGYWGNYQIADDTIKIETIASYGGRFHHVRNTLIGLIKTNSINFLYNIDRDGTITENNYTVRFERFNVKPDSTSNWIRTKRKFNR